MNKLMRSRRNKMVAGVIAGLLDSYGVKIDTSIARIIVGLAVFSPLSGIVVAGYLLAWVILPREPLSALEVAEVAAEVVDEVATAQTTAPEVIQLKKTNNPASEA